jgi:hypothetical protein
MYTEGCKPWLQSAKFSLAISTASIYFFKRMLIPLLQNRQFDRVLMDQYIARVLLKYILNKYIVYTNIKLPTMIK